MKPSRNPSKCFPARSVLVAQGRSLFGLPHNSGLLVQLLQQPPDGLRLPAVRVPHDQRPVDARGLRGELPSSPIAGAAIWKLFVVPFPAALCCESVAAVKMK